MRIGGRARMLYAALAATGMAAGCSTIPEKSPAQARADEATAERVSLALNDNPVFYFRDVDVNVDYGVAILGGYVWTTDALYSAQNIARSVPGVTRVVDQMELSRAAMRGGGDGGGG
jgi:osmotically-inducible protein OsmY